jgi:hypothetical protein
MRRALHFLTSQLSSLFVHRRGNKLLSLFTLLVLLIALPLTVLFSQQRQEIRQHAASQPLAIHVVGNQLVNAQGQAIRLIGINRLNSFCSVTGSNASITFGPSDAADVALMADWHINAVRLTLHEDCWLGINNAPAQYSGNNYRSAIVNFVNLLHSYGMYAIISLVENAPGTYLAQQQQVMADADHAPAFWTSVASTFKNDPAVIFEPYNEPFIDTTNAQTTNPWQCLRDGCTITQYYPCFFFSCPAISLNWQAAGMQNLVNTIRATGATNVITISGLNKSADLSQLLQYLPHDSQNQLTATFHNYGDSATSNGGCGPSCWDSVIAPLAQKIPVITDEYGQDNCQTSYITQFMDWADQHHISYLPWAWTNWGCSGWALGLLTDWNGTRSSYGQVIYDHFHTVSFTINQPTNTPTPTPLSSTTPTTSPHQNSGFVTRIGSSLYLNGQKVRMAGPNIDYLGIVEGVYRYPTHYEIDDALNTAKTMHATVVRIRTVESVGCSLCIEPSLNQFNDKAFEPIDYTIKEAGALGLRVYMPLVDGNYYFMGGKRTYAQWRGVPESAFFTNQTLIQDYEAHIAHVLHHVNQYTGVAYDNDPTIMAWATGNELYQVDSSGNWVAGGFPLWTQTIASYIKSLAPNQLTIDGALLIDQNSLDLPATDSIEQHGYPPSVSQIQQDAALVTQHSKVFIFGEFDWTNQSQYSWETKPHTVTPLADTIQALETSNVSVDTYFELLGKTDNGSYLTHGAFTLNWPGTTPDMQTRAQQLANHACRMNSSAGCGSGSPTPAPTSPVAQTPTPKPTFTPTPTNPTPTWYCGGSQYCSGTPTPTVTSALTPTSTVYGGGTPTATPVVTNTPSGTATPTVIASVSVTPTPTYTPRHTLFFSRFISKLLDLLAMLRTLIAKVLPPPFTHNGK